MSDFLRRRLLLPLMGIVLLMILASALCARFSEPSLVIRHAAQPETRAEAAAMEDGGALMQALAADPGNAELAMTLARRLLDSGQIQAALVFASRAHAIAPDRADAPALLGYLESRLGRYRQAAGLLEESLKLEDNPRVRYSLGVLCSYYLDDPVSGRRHFEAALASPAADAELAARSAAELRNGAGQPAPR